MINWQLPDAFFSLIWAIEAASKALLSDFIADLKTFDIGMKSWQTVLPVQVCKSNTCMCNENRNQLPVLSNTLDSSLSFCWRVFSIRWIFLSSHTAIDRLRFFTFQKTNNEQHRILPRMQRRWSFNWTEVCNLTLLHCGSRLKTSLWSASASLICYELFQPLSV